MKPAEIFACCRRQEQVTAYTRRFGVALRMPAASYHHCNLDTTHQHKPRDGNLNANFSTSAPIKRVAHFICDHAPKHHTGVHLLRFLVFIPIQTPPPHACSSRPPRFRLHNAALLSPHPSPSPLWPLEPLTPPPHRTQCPKGHRH